METNNTSERLPDSSPVYSPDQIAARRASSLRRAAAMIRSHDELAGMKFSALTPATFSRLVLMESPFLRRGIASRADVSDYLWAHWPGFELGNDSARAAFDRRLRSTLFPPWLRWRWSAQAWHTRTAATWADLAVRISELMEVAFADEPPPSADSTNRTSASFEAQMIDLFARMYGWEPERTRNTPVRQLYQLMRCSDRTDYDSAEAAVIAAELAHANAARIAQANASQAAA